MRIENIKEPLSFKNIKPFLKELEREANAAVRLCYLKRHDDSFGNAAVNWADFRCVGAELVTSTMTEPPVYWSVCVEEASPENYEVQKFIAEILSDKWGYVQVVTEW